VRNFLKKLAWLLALALVVVLGTTFASQNFQSVTIAYFDWRWEGNLLVALFVALLSGFVLGVLPGWCSAFFARRELRRKSVLAKAPPARDQSLR